MDGVFVVDSAWAQPVFYPVPPPTDQELLGIAMHVATRVQRLLQQGLDDGSTDDLAEHQPLLSACANASIAGTDLFERRRYGAQRLRSLPPTPPSDTGCVNVEGFYSPLREALTGCCALVQSARQAAHRGA